MIPVKQLLNEVIASLRNVIAPAIADPYPKAQAYMAAVILEFVARQVEERGDLETAKRAALETLFRDLSVSVAPRALPGGGETDAAARLCRVIEWLYAERDGLGPDAFAAASTRVRR